MSEKRGSSWSRRAFLAAGAAAPAVVRAGEIAPSKGSQRVSEAFQVRMDAAQLHRDLPVPEQSSNDDERTYTSRAGNFSKGLPHNDLGEVDTNAYNALLFALSSGRPEDFEAIPSGCPDPTVRAKLVDPQAGLAFDLEGADSHHMAIPPAPRCSSAEAAGEAVELYWKALARDVSFTEYESNPITQAAAAELLLLSDFRGPKAGGRVSPGTLFRGFTAGDLAGPYISQFLLRPIPFGAQTVDQRLRTVTSGVDYLTAYPDWLAAQNGFSPPHSDRFDSTRRYVRNGRDLAAWVHRDVLFQAYFNAALILMAAADATDEVTGGGIGAPLSSSNPYERSRNQTGFGTWGPPYISTVVAEVATRALKAVWYQKWFVHRRLRPEEYGGRLHNLLIGRADYQLNRDVVNSGAVNRVFANYGTYLLPQAFPEGCPLHPSYGAGHATVAGACVTILKALFEESYLFPNPVVPSADGLSLVRYTGRDADRLTVGNELNKLAANVAMGRNFAGIHWRSDYARSLRLGETVAISLLQDHKLTFNEDFQGFAFTTFDGRKVTV